MREIVVASSAKIHSSQSNTSSSPPSLPVCREGGPWPRAGNMLWSRQERSTLCSAGTFAAVISTTVSVQLPQNTFSFVIQHTHSITACGVIGLCSEGCGHRLWPRLNYPVALTCGLSSLTQMIRFDLWTQPFRCVAVIAGHRPKMKDINSFVEARAEGYWAFYSCSSVKCTCLLPR